jgi:hypothetical protein
MLHPLSQPQDLLYILCDRVVELRDDAAISPCGLPRGERDGGDMTAFILSAALAFAVYELLAFAEIPKTKGRLPTHGMRLTFIRGVRVTLTERPARWARQLLRMAIVVAVLATTLFFHELASPLDAISRNKVNIVIGFVFGPLLAIWVNSIIVHDPRASLSRGQIVAGIGLVLLFLLGAVGDEMAGLIRRYSRSITSVKLAGAELSFAERSRRDSDRVAATPITGSPTRYVSRSSNGLGYLTQLESMIVRDGNYIKLFAPPNTPVPDMSRAHGFAQDIITPPMKCLSAWQEHTGDQGLVNKHLIAFAEAFRQVEILNDGRRAAELSQSFIRSAVAMGYDIVASTSRQEIETDCVSWLTRFCPSPLLGTSPPRIFDRSGVLRCMKDWLDQIDKPPAERRADVATRISELGARLWNFVDQDGVQLRPYFAIGYASIMAQLGHYEAAAAILDGWLQQFSRLPFTGHPSEKEWLALRARSILAAYVEEWLQREGGKSATVLQNEHLANLDVLRSGFKRRLMKAEFFRQLPDACGERCEIVMKRPGECSSSEAGIEQWQTLFSSYVSMELTHVQTALSHPDYKANFAETTNLEVRRLANFDLSCGAAFPDRATLLAQVFEALARSAIQYSAARAETESEETRLKRLAEAERAARFGMEIIAVAAADEEQRAGQRFLKRIEASLTLEAHERLKRVLEDLGQEKSRLSR